MSECGVCNVIIDDNKSSAIGCDRCSIWFHISCVKISAAGFRELNKNKFYWYCEQCKECNLSSSTMSTHNDTIINKESDSTLKTILSTLQILLSRFDHLERRSEVFDSKLTAVNEKVDTVDSKCDATISEVDSLKKAVEILQSENAVLHRMFNHAEKSRRQTDLLVEGIPSKTGENTQDIVLKIANHIKCDLSKEGISSSFRLTTHSGITRPLLVKFANKTIRDAFYFSYLKERNLTLSDIMPELNLRNRIFINENLTAENRSFLRRCAALKVKHLIFHYSTKNGAVYAKIGKDEVPVLVTADFLQRMEGSQKQQQ